MQTLDSRNSLFERDYDPFNQDLIRYSDKTEYDTSGTVSIGGQINDIASSTPQENRGFYTHFYSICRFFKRKKFGTWDGVYLSCLLAMFGVIMFLRLGFIVGQSGIWQTWLVELLSILIVFITTLSMAVVASNGEIKHGGAYYLISRSLGPEIGGSVGILFSLGNSIAAGLHILGFVEPLVFQVGLHMTESVKYEMIIYGMITLFILVIFAFIGVSWMIKLQIFIAVIILISIMCFFVSCFITKNSQYLIVGSNLDTFKGNFNSNYSKSENFITMFGVFFPAMTGIMAGANLSGDLINPSKSIAKGTISAVFTAGVIYISMSTVLASVVLRGNCSQDIVSSGLCYNMIMEKVTIPGWIIYVGIYAATLSSALAALVGAPRILTTVARDKILKMLYYFSVQRKNGEPLYAYIPVVIIAAGCIAIADLNIIANVVTITYLMTYSLVNIACFQSSFSKSPGWRPKFKFYNQWIALLAAITCFCLTFILGWRVAIPAAALALIFFLLIYWKKPNINWGSATQAVATKTIVKNLLSQRKQEEHIKNFRPNFLILTRDPIKDIKLIKFIQTLKKCYGANFLGVVKKESFISKPDDDFFEAESFEKNTNIVLFQKKFFCKEYYEGCYILLQTFGIGKIKPNTVFIKHETNWRRNMEVATKFFEFLCKTCSERFALMIALNFESMHFSKTDPFGTVDIWWLYDDGGLSVLIPHILSKSVFWKKNSKGGKGSVPLRLFVISREVTSDKANITNLLKRFRLDIRVKCVYPEEGKESFKGAEEKNFWIPLANLMKKHSKRAKLVFCTMPIPQIKQSAKYFLNILDLLSEDMPSMIMIRGNGKSVLTWSQE